MHRPSAAAAVALLAFAAACGPLEPGDEAATLAAGDPAPVARDAGGTGVGLQLSTAALTAGSTLTVTVRAGSGARVYLSYSKTLFAGPAWVRIPSGQAAASVTLYSSPFLTAPASTTISARTANPDPASYASQAVALAPALGPPATRPQVASAVLTPAAVLSGDSSTLDVTLTAPAPEAGAAVLVAISNDFFGLDAEVAPVVLVPAGATRASATLRTHLSNGVATSVTEHVVANLFGGTFQGGPLEVMAR